MEIIDYLRTARRRRWILVIPPLLAGAAALVPLVNGPREYRATATVAGSVLIGAPGAQYSGPTAARSFVSDFTAIVRSPAVLQATAESTGLPRARLAPRLSAVAVGEGAVVKVTYRSAKRTMAGRVANTAANEALARFVGSQLDLARYPVEQAQSAVDEVDAELASFLAQAGPKVSDRDYQLQAQQVLHLEEAAIEAAARGEAGVAAQISAALPAKQRDLDVLAEKVAAYSVLLDRRTRAVKQLDEASVALHEAEALQQVANPESIVSTGLTREVSLFEEGLRKVAVASGAALFLVVGLLVLFETSRGRGVRQLNPA